MSSHEPAKHPKSTSNPFHRHLLPGLNGLTTDGHWQSPLPLPFPSHGQQQITSHHAVFQLTLPDLDMVAQEGPACSEIFDNHSHVSVIFVAHGNICLQHQDSRWCCTNGDCLIVPRIQAHWSSTAFSVVCLTFAEQPFSERIHTLHAQLIGLDPSTPPTLQQPVSCQASDGNVEASLLRSLHLLLCICSDLQAECPSLLPHLGIGQQLGNLTALLALPDLRHPAVDKSSKLDLKNSSLEHLIDYIDCHLSQPLSLDILEDQSHYSRRALQYAFRKRFGCTVTQWIRARRLDLAHSRLSMAVAGDSVGTIARTCGYRSMSLFSIEFQQRFHVKPSVLLREAMGDPDLNA